MKKINIDKITMDDQTQIRCDIDKSTVDNYARAIEAGEILPPIQVVEYQGHYIIADGFHRFLAHQKTQQETIDVQIIKGGIAKAIVTAAQANTTNGLPLTQADKRKAIGMILTATPAATDREVARLVNVSDKTVAKQRHELVVAGKITDERTGKYATKSYTQSAEIPQLHDSANGEVKDERTGKFDSSERVSRVGNLPTPSKNLTTKPASQPKNDDLPPIPSMAVPTPPMPAMPNTVTPPPAEAAKTDQPITDKIGQVVTNPISIAILERDHEITKICSTLTAIRKQVKDACAAGDRLYTGLSLQCFEAGLVNARNTLKFSRRAYVCPYCAGDGCEACKDSGLVNEAAYDMAPSELQSGVK